MDARTTDEIVARPQEVERQTRSNRGSKKSAETCQPPPTSFNGVVPKAHCETRKLDDRLMGWMLAPSDQQLSQGAGVGDAVLLED